MPQVPVGIGFESSAPETSPVTVVLTNWKRPQNLTLILDQLATQTVKPVIFLWNNAEKFSHPAIRWMADSSVNMACQPRWWMASCAMTPFVCIMDDDLILDDTRLLEDMVAFLSHRTEQTIAGFVGVKLVPSNDYHHSVHLKAGADADQPVDIVKGRFMMMRSSALRRIHLHPSPSRDVLICDDIRVSGSFADGRSGQHVLPAIAAGRWRELPNEHSLYTQEGHFEHREKARREAFPF